MTGSTRRLLFMALRVGAVVCAVAATAPAPATASDAGALDAEFGASGRVRLDAARGKLRIAAQAGGKLLVAAPTQPGIVRLSRLRANGTVDASFGNAGAVEIPADPNQAWLWSEDRLVSDLTVQDDGRILVLVQSASGPELRRFDADGAVDNSFGSAGIVALGECGGPILPGTAGTFATAGARFTGIRDKYEMLLCRFDSSGGRAVGFGVDGIAATGLTGRPLDAFAGPDGRVSVAGTDAGQAFAARLSVDGSPDPGFGDGGRANLSISPIEGYNERFFATSVAAVADEWMLFGGVYYFAGCSLQGGGDCDWSHEGWVDPSAKDQRNSTSGFEDETLAVTGQHSNAFLIGGSEGFSVRRFGADRRPFAGFGVNGVTIPYRSAIGASVSDAVTMPDGKLVVAGAGYASAELVRLLGDRPGIAAPSLAMTEFGTRLLRSHRKLSVAGLASPNDANVEIALRWVDGSRSERRRGCRWLDAKSKRFKRFRGAVRGRVCGRPRFFSIGRAPSWRFATKSRLRAGSYELYARAVSRDRLLASPLERWTDGFKPFKVKRS